jgi:cysteine desulfuration protein SufE
MTLPQHPFGDTITSEHIAQQLQNCSSWEDKYRYVIQLSRQLPKFDENQQDSELEIQGCESQVWLLGEENNGMWYWAADSDARIVRGLIAIVLALFQGKNAEETQDLNVETYFASLGLINHLTPTRNNGLFAIIQAIQERVRSAR